MRHVALALLVLTALGAVACASGHSEVGMTPSASVTTTTAGWEHYFKLDWSAEPSKNGGQRVSGYVYNDYGRPAARMQMLAQAFDPANNLVGQRLAWVGGTVPPLSRSYFEIDGLLPADHYRVSVWSWDFVEGVPGRLFP